MSTKGKESTVNPMLVGAAIFGGAVVLKTLFSLGGGETKPATYVPTPAEKIVFDATENTLKDKGPLANFNVGNNIYKVSALDPNSKYGGTDPSETTYDQTNPFTVHIDNRDGKSNTYYVPLDNHDRGSFASAANAESNVVNTICLGSTTPEYVSVTPSGEQDVDHTSSFHSGMYINVIPGQQVDVYGAHC